ncbi:putative S-locus glycoprotein domain-containing protein, partial [Tanacetum coccineum]
MVILDGQGVLSIVNGGGTNIWSSNSSAPNTNVNLIAQLLDGGNLVIKDESSFIWESFDYPGDTLIHGMKLGKNFITGRENYLTSWKSADDPSPREYTIRSVMTPRGKLEIWLLNMNNQEWMHDLTVPGDYCDNYGTCGPYGSCSTATFPNCVCLKGFELTYTQELYPYNWKAGYEVDPWIECEVACKDNCSCTAYANPNNTRGGVGCLHWFGDLIDVRVYSLNGQDFYVRLAASELL